MTLLCILQALFLSVANRNSFLDQVLLVKRTDVSEEIKSHANWLWSYTDRE